MSQLSMIAPCLSLALGMLREVIVGFAGLDQLNDTLVSHGAETHTLRQSANGTVQEIDFCFTPRFEILEHG